MPRTADVLRSVVRSALIGAAIGLPILGVGGRVIMRVIAHWEGRVPAFSVGGTGTVVFMGVMAGLAGGAVHGVLGTYVRNIWVRNSLFLVICVAFTWRAVNALLPRPRLTFVALTVVYVIAMEILAPSKRREAASLSGAQAVE